MDNEVSEQPHRKLFTTLIGPSGATDWKAGFALGRLRLIGEVEEREEVEKGVNGRTFVRRVLFSGHRHAPRGPFGISERRFFAGMKYLETVGRERFVRSAPKDKPSAIAFLTARGIDLSAKELSDGQASKYVADFEEARAALNAAACPPDVRRVLRTLRRMARKSGALAIPMLPLLGGIGVLSNPTVSEAIAHAVNALVIDDRDPDQAAFEMAMLGLEALADHYFGPERGDRRAIAGWGDGERPTWPHEERVIEILYPDGQGGTRPALKEPPRRGRGGDTEARGGWKGRHRRLGG